LAAGTSLACRLVIATTAATTTDRLAPTPMISTGMSRSHWPEDDAVLVPFVDVVLLVVVVATVTA